MKESFIENLTTKGGFVLAEAEKEYEKLVSGFTVSLMLIAFEKFPPETKKSIVGELDVSLPENQSGYLQKVKEYLDKNKTALEPKDFARAIAAAYEAYEKQSSVVMNK